MGLLIRPTTKVVARDSGAWSGATPLAAGASGGGTIAAKLISARVGGVWAMRYSTPTGVLSGGGANAASGASSAGRAQVNATATPGGENSGNLSYSWQSGGSLQYLNANTATITAYFDFTGVANGSTSAAQTNSTLYCIITDNETGAQWQTSTITVGPLTWTNTIPAFSAHNTLCRTPGSGTEYVPAGATSLTIKVAAAGGGGGGSSYDIPTGDFLDGEAGGDGGVTSVTRAISPSDWNTPIYWTVGAGAGVYPAIGGASSVTGAVAAGSLNLSTTGGVGGVYGSTGHSGSSGTKGTPNNALFDAPYGQGGAPGTAGGGASTGNPGEVQFIWT